MELKREMVIVAMLNTPFILTNKYTKIEMGIPDHLTWLLRNLYAGQEATVGTGHGTTDWFQIRKGEGKGCLLSPCLFNSYTEYIMQNVRLDEAQAGIKIARRNTNDLRYADDTTLTAESEEELKSLLMKVKEESEKVGLNLDIQKTKIMASRPNTSGWRRLLRVYWTARRSNQSILKEISPEYSLEGLMLKLTLQYSGHLMWRTDSLGKNPDARKDWRQEEKGTTEDEMVGWLHQLNGHGFEWTPGVGDGQGGLVSCSPWGRKELDTTEQLIWTELMTDKRGKNPKVESLKEKTETLWEDWWKIK